MVYSVSSTTSWRSAPIMHSLSIPSLNRILATATGCMIYGSPERRYWFLCASCARLYAFSILSASYWELFFISLKKDLKPSSYSFSIVSFNFESSLQGFHDACIFKIRLLTYRIDCYFFIRRYQSRFTKGVKGKAHLTVSYTLKAEIQIII